ncbi:MAG TPA: retropepsin-like aspartic protease [Rhizomicrobium sp.]|nr:retropepsin-like aspartic protease [Rhizomicrobium sp.]
MAAVLTLGLAASPAAAALIGDPASQAEGVVPIEAHDGAYAVPVVINGVLTENFIIDSGSADVSIPAGVAAALIRSGTMSGSDLIGSKTYVMADGSRVPSDTYRLSSLKIGDLVMQNVTVRVAAEKSHFLLGQSFLSRLKSWSMDNGKLMLLINQR